jgi:hypothetical protein
MRPAFRIEPIGPRSRVTQCSARRFPSEWRAEHGAIERRKNSPRRPTQTRRMNIALLALAVTSVSLGHRGGGKHAAAQGDNDSACPICDHPFGNLSSHACIG